MFLKKIVDIKISNNEISVIRKAKISLHDLLNQISNLKYSGQALEKITAAENAKLPPFIQVFYSLFFQTLTIPTESEFYKTYFEWIGGVKNGKLIYEDQSLNPIGVENRIKRSYPSLIRDLHFLYLLEASEKFEKVEYSMKMDYYNGLDLKVIYKGIEYFVSLFIDSTRGKYFKQKKLKRHDYSEVNEITFNVQFDEMIKVGDIYLLTDLHVEILENNIKES